MGQGVLRLKPGKQQALRTGRPWVYRGEIARVQGDPAPGDVISVVDDHGAFCAYAFYHPTSLLAARCLSRNPGETIDDAFFVRRLKAACDLRQRLCVDPATARLVFAEADGLPGLVADRLGDVIVLQTLTVGMDRRLALVAATLGEITGVSRIYERNTGPVRRLEGLPERAGALVGTFDEVVSITEGDVRLDVDLRLGQKTGHFLDQRENRLEFGRLCRRLLPLAGAPDLGVLDAFSHTGGFGLQALASGTTSVKFLDSAPQAVHQALDNATKNGFTACSGEVGNAFDVLRAYEREGHRFAAIVLDPPAFARGRAQLDGAYRGYKEINLRAMRLLAPGGLLVSCSCSAPVSDGMFTDLLRDAAADAGRAMRLIGRRGAAPDHPALLGADETHYLKCCFLLAAE